MGDELLDDVARRLRWRVLGGLVAGLALSTAFLVIGVALEHEVPHGTSARWVVLRNVAWEGPVDVVWVAAWWVLFSRRIERIRAVMAAHFQDPDEVDLVVSLPKVATHLLVVWLIAAVAAPPLYNDGVLPVTQLPFVTAANVFIGLALASALYLMAEAITRPLLGEALEVVPVGRPRPPAFD